MKYSVLSIPPFDRQLKRLARKYHALKVEYTAFVEELEHNLHKGERQWGIIASRYVWLFPQKVAENQVEQE